MATTYTKAQLLAGLDKARDAINRASKDSYTAEEFAEMIAADSKTGERFIIPLIIVVAILLYSQSAN